MEFATIFIKDKENLSVKVL